MEATGKTHTLIDSGIEASGEICKSSVAASLMLKKKNRSRLFETGKVEPRSPIMAKNQTSAEKRFAQSEVRRLHNKAIKSECRTCARQFVEAVAAKDEKLAQEKLNKLSSKLDSARSKGVLTRNAVSRKKSRMATLFNKTFKASK